MATRVAVVASGVASGGGQHLGLLSPIGGPSACTSSSLSKLRHCPYRPTTPTPSPDPTPTYPSTTTDEPPTAVAIMSQVHALSDDQV